MLAELLLTPPQPGAAPRATPRILVAFDGSPGAWRALDAAIRLAGDHRAELTIAGVVHDPTPWFACANPLVMVPVMRVDAEIGMQQTLAAARDEVPATITAEVRVLHGRPAATLTALADSGRYDLVVTGPRPACRLGRLVRRSVTHALVTRSRTSVLAVKA
jgi:nucleotide-binding universal stress UspA family protein